MTSASPPGTTPVIPAMLVTAVFSVRLTFINTYCVMLFGVKGLNTPSLVQSSRESPVRAERFSDRNRFGTKVAKQVMRPSGYTGKLLNGLLGPPADVN